MFVTLETPVDQLSDVVMAQRGLAEAVTEFARAETDLKPLNAVISRYVKRTQAADVIECAAPAFQLEAACMPAKLSL